MEKLLWPLTWTLLLHLWLSVVPAMVFDCVSYIVLQTGAECRSCLGWFHCLAFCEPCPWLIFTNWALSWGIFFTCWLHHLKALIDETSLEEQNKGGKGWGPQYHFDRISNSLTCGGRGEGMSVLHATIEDFEVDGDQGRLEVGENPGLSAWGRFCFRCSVIRCCLQVAGVHWRFHIARILIMIQIWFSI